MQKIIFQQTRLFFFSFFTESLKLRGTKQMLVHFGKSFKILSNILVGARKEIARLLVSRTRNYWIKLNDIKEMCLRKDEL